MPRKYPEEFRSRAVRFVDEAIATGESRETAAVSRVASRLGVSKRNPLGVISTTTTREVLRFR